MTRYLAPLVLLLACLAAPAAAGCKVEYKAKRDNPLKLDFATVRLPDAACTSKKTAAAALAPQLAAKGWTLLTIVSILKDG